ncbi:TetR/AcrR family transcriptional regulator [Corynebacterium sp. H78]|uniref:TetR/AcrR family transcriptional regulator n=1 Tax=Corynebacterium sp. H78 TaxID=3133417 RepID=UPI003099DB2C
MNLESAHPSHRRRLTAVQRREDILDAAATLYSTGSPHDYTIEDIAQKAGVSRATFYRLFEGIEDLKASIIGRIATAFQKRMFSGFGSDNQWVELVCGIQEFLSITDAVRCEVLSLLDSHSQGTIAEGMRSAIVAEISRRVRPIKETQLGHAALRTWVAAAEYQVRRWLMARSEDESSAESREVVAERLAALLIAVVVAFKETNDDAFLEEVFQVLDEGRTHAGEAG